MMDVGTARLTDYQNYSNAVLRFGRAARTESLWMMPMPMPMPGAAVGATGAGDIDKGTAIIGDAKLGISGGATKGPRQSGKTRIFALN